LWQFRHVPRSLSTTQVLARFGVRVAVLGCFAAFSNVGFARSLAALFWMAIILCALVGLITREPPFRAPLNHWDEAVAFGALFALIHVVSNLGAA
jgi:hypothetical protein